MARATLPLSQDSKEIKTVEEIRILVADALGALPNSQPVKPESIAVLSGDDGQGRWSIAHVDEDSNGNSLDRRNAIRNLQDKYRLA